MPIPMFVWLRARRGEDEATPRRWRSRRDVAERRGRRRAAGRRQGPGRDEESGGRGPLGEALADADPAMQYRAVLSLKKVTGKDLGNDVDRWQQYVKGRSCPRADPVAGRASSPV